MKYENFYENLKEAKFRLRNTVVVYDKWPYYVLNITDHRPDKIFRVYLLPIGSDYDLSVDQDYPMNKYPHDYPEIGSLLDAWMVKKPNTGVLRKHMNSPLFNRFRPFPLGMVNEGGKTYYVERTPLRKSEQGLTDSSLDATVLSLSPFKGLSRSRIGSMSPAMKACIINDYPSPELCVEMLRSPDVVNEAVGFHRRFAFVKGPIGMLFLAYKGDIIGCLPKGDLSGVKLGSEFEYTREVVEDLRIFNEIQF